MKPNILFIMTDQQSATMMSCTGNKYLRTPSMDYIAENGVRFERAYCTNSVCVPSRFSLFTGKMPSFINLKDNSTEEVNYDRIEELKKQGIGYLLKDAGYHAVYAGKQHFPTYKAEDLGFDILTTDEREELTEKCVEFIRVNKDKPYFLVASFINPHDICCMAQNDFAEAEKIDSSYIPDQIKVKHDILNSPSQMKNINEFLSIAKEGGSDFVEKECPPLPENYLPQKNEPGAVDYLIHSKPFRLYARENYTDNDWRMYRYVYHKLTEKVDKKTGDLLQALKESGQEENTVIIFTSDHGDMNGSHKVEHKSVLYNEATRVPFLIYQKGVTPKGLVDHTNLISNGLDLIPTICDYAGVKTPGNLEGKSIRPIVEGEGEVNFREAVKVESEIGRMIVTTDYKYAQFYMGDNNEQLYDLQNDPYEMKNSAFEKTKNDELIHHRSLFKEVFD